MSQKIICLLVAAVLLFSIAPVIAPAGPQPSSSGSSSGGGGGGGGGSHLTLESFTNNLVSWQKENPTKYQYMIKLLSKGNVQAYNDPIIALGYSKNKSINRNEQLDIKFQVQNPNSIDLRIPLFVDLEAKVQGSDEFKRVNQNSMVVQPFAYSEMDKLNVFESSWPEIGTLSQLEKKGVLKLRTGVIKFRAVYSDGSRKKYSSDWIFDDPSYYGELALNLTNRPPEMKNITLAAPNQTRYNDPIEYKATIDDPDGDMLNVTLHIIDNKGKEYKNETQNIKPGDVTFKSSEYGFFGESDAGKNFTYYYSFDDGMNRNKTENETGPFIRRGPKLYVDKLNVTAESSSCYWWNWYTFNVRAKNLNPEEYDVVFTLFTKTENGDWKTMETKTAKVGKEPQMIYFNKTKPFTVADANSSFLYRIKLSEYDQTGKDVLQADGLRINAKIVPYSMSNPIMLANLFLMLLFIVGLGLFMERTLKRGIEAQESSSVKSKKNNGNGGRSVNGASGGMISRISAIFRRRN
jgi:hypothetical protein